MGGPYLRMGGFVIKTHNLFTSVPISTLLGEYPANFKGISTEDMPLIDPEAMLTNFSEKFATLEYTYDFFTPDMFLKTFKKKPDPKSIVQRNGIWGSLVLPDGKHRANVPQLSEGISAGRQGLNKLTTTWTSTPPPLTRTGYITFPLTLSLSLFYVFLQNVETPKHRVCSR